jgi:hypothetical protein
MEKFQDIIKNNSALGSNFAGCQFKKRGIANGDNPAKRGATPTSDQMDFCRAAGR